MKNWPDLRNGELRVIPSCDYEMCLLPLAEVDEKAGLAKTTVPASRTMGRVKFMDETAWVENILEVLDEPGEWVFSAAERKLYLWPTRGAPSDAINAPRLTELLRIEGAIDYDGPADKPVTGLVFRGLTFTGGERLPWNGATKGELQHKWEHFDSPSALVRLRGARDCTIQGCRFVNTSGTGLRLDLTCLDNRVIDNEVAHTGGVGILLAGYGPGTKDVNKRNDRVEQLGPSRWRDLLGLARNHGMAKRRKPGDSQSDPRHALLGHHCQWPNGLDERDGRYLPRGKSTCRHMTRCQALPAVRVRSIGNGGRPEKSTCTAEKTSLHGTKSAT